MPEGRSVSVFLRAFTGQYEAAMAKARATTTQFGTAAATAGSQWSSLGRRTQTVGRELSHVGSTLNRRVTLPVLALGAGSLKTAVDFETAFTGIRKTIDATEAQYRELERGIMSMAERLPASVEEISAVAEAAGQLGVERKNILSFTETMIDLGESTNLSADNAATWAARFANITGMPQRNFERLGSTVVELGNKGASTEEEIASMSLRIAGAGKQVGLTEAEILGFAESLSSVGIESQAGGSAISRTFITMANDVAAGGEKLEAFANVAGTTSEAFKQQFETDAAGAMISFIEGLDRIKKEGGNVFEVLEDLGLSEIRVRDALLRAAGASDLFAQSQKTANAEWERSNALSKESEKRYKTTAAELEKLKNQFRNVLARFGKDLMPILKDGAEAASELADWFGELDPEMRKNIIKWAGIAAVAGPVLRIFGAITTAIGVILRGGGAAAKLVARIATAAAGTGAGAGAGAGSGAAAAAGGGVLGALGFGAIVGAGTGVVAGSFISEVLDEKDFEDKRISNLKDLVDWVWEYRRAVEAGKISGKEFREAMRGISKEAQNIADSQGMFDKDLSSLVELVNSNVDHALAGFQEAIEGVRDGFQGAGDALNNIVGPHERAKEAAADHEQKVRGLSSALHNVPSRVDSRVDVRGIDPVLAGLRAIANALSSIDGRVVTSTVNVRSVRTGYTNQVQHSGGNVGTGPTRHGTGLRSDEISTILQRGELVLSRADVQAAARGGGSSEPMVVNHYHNHYNGSFVAGGRAGVNELASNMESAERERSILLKGRPGSKR